MTKYPPSRFACAILFLPFALCVNGCSNGDSLSAAPTAWPQFRGPGAVGSTGGGLAPVEWNVEQGTNILWKTAIPGLGLSAPSVWGNRVFVTTAVAETGDQPLKPGLYGDIKPVADEGRLSWKLLCLDRETGKVLWDRTCHEGVPKVKRHPKSSHANCAPAVDGKRVVAFFGSEGLYCFDLNGRPIWNKDFGVLSSAFYLVPEAEWGFASSPVLYENRVIIQADVMSGSFLAALDATNGQELWRTSRNDVPTWSTPTVHRDPAAGRTQIICNGYREAAGYDLATGHKLWTLSGGGDIPVPTPIIAGDLIYLTSAHGRLSPIYAIKPSATGDISLKQGQTSNEHIAWSIPRGGNYMQTPIVVGDFLYCCLDNGMLTCFEARTGKQLYRQRLDGIGFTASAVASGDRIHFASEDGLVHVVQAGPVFKLLATNPLGGNCLATPAVSDGVLFFRTQKELVAVGSRSAR